MATVLGSLLIQLGLDSGQFKSGLSQSERELKAATKRIERVGQRMTNIGAKMSVAVTAPILAIAASSAKVASEARDAFAQVEASLASMGNGAGRSAEQLKAQGKELQYLSTFDDAEILRGVTANMLTFGNIAGEQFDRAQRAAVDMATKMDTDLKSATIQLGKALNIPSKGLSQLTRVGIDFTQAQKEQIRAMEEAGDMAGAQTIILGELERQFKGSGKAARDAVPGSDITNKWNDFRDTVGETLLVAFERVEPVLTRLMDRFANLSPTMQTFVTVSALAAAALGPLAVVAGSVVQLTAPLIASLTGAGAAAGGASVGFSGLAAAALPIVGPLAAVAGIGALIYANWDKIAPVLEKVRARFVEAIGPKLTALVDTVRETLTKLWDGPLGEGIRKVLGYLGNFQSAYLEVFGEALTRVLSAAIDIVTGVFEQIGNAIDFVVKLLTGDFAGAWEAIKNIVDTAVKTVLRVIASLAPSATKHLQALYIGAKRWMQDKLGAVFDWVRSKIEAVERSFAWLYDKVVGNSWVPDMVSDIADHMARLDSAMVDKAQAATRKTGDAFRALAGEVAALMRSLFPQAAALADYRADLATIDKGAAAGLLSDDQAASARAERLSQLRTDRDSKATVSKPLLAAGDRPLIDSDEIDRRLEAFQRSLGNVANGTKVQTVRIAESFNDMAQKTIGALDRMVGAVKGGGLLDILGAVIGLVTQLSSIGAFGKVVAGRVNAPQIPAYAAGTAFHPGGLALVGERGPELASFPRGTQIASNRETRAMMEPRRVEIVPSPYFDVVVDGRIERAAPLIAKGAAVGAQRSMARRQMRRV